MKKILFSDLYAETVILSIIILIYLNTAAYIYAAWNPALLPKYLYYLMILIGVPVFLIKQKKTARVVLNTPFIIWGIVYLVVSLPHWFFGDNRSSDVAATRIQYVIMGLYFAVLLKLPPTDRWQKIFPLIAIAVSGATLLDFFYPELLWPPKAEDRVLGRASGFQNNTNTTGQVIIMTVLLALPTLMPLKRVLLMAFAGLGIFVTFSRASLIMWAIVLVVGLVVRVFHKSGWLLLGVAITLLLAAPALLQQYLPPEYQGGMANLLYRIESVINLEASDFSAYERSQALQQSIGIFFEEPLIGAGAGAAEIRFGVGPHNELALMGAEYGIPGILLWLSLLFMLFHGRYFKERPIQFMSGVTVLIYTFFSHNLLDYPVWFITYALLTDRRPYWRFSKLMPTVKPIEQRL